MSQFVICQTGASSLLAPYNLPLWQCVDPMDDDDDSDVEHFGELPVYGALGVSSMPWPKTQGGWCESLVARDVDGYDGVVIGARDRRSAVIYGALEQGDTAIHTTGPEQSAQVLLKEKGRSASIVARQADGKQIVLTLDADNKRLQILGMGNAIQLTEDGITLDAKSGGITIANGTIQLRGGVVFGSGVGALPMLQPPAGVPIPGIFVSLVFWGLFLCEVFSESFRS
ncbi:MAG: hypothetical protein V3S15_01375 [Woeseiaceae bacterium]